MDAREVGESGRREWVSESGRDYQRLVKPAAWTTKATLSKQLMNLIDKCNGSSDGMAQ